MIIRNYDDNCLFNFDLGDKRLDERALLIFARLKNKYGKPLSKISSCKFFVDAKLRSHRLCR